MEGISKKISSEAFQALLVDKNKMVRFLLTRPRLEHEIIIDYNSTVRLEQEFFRNVENLDFNRNGTTFGDISPVIMNWKISDLVKTYQNFAHQIQLKASYPNNFDGLTGLVLYLQTNPLDLTFDGNIFHLVNFYYNLPKPLKRGDNNNFIYNNWQVGVSNKDIDARDSNRKRLEFVVNLTNRGINPFFFGYSLTDQFIFDTHRDQTGQDQTLTRLPVNSIQRIYYTEKKQSITSHNLGQLMFDKISVASQLDYQNTYVVREGDENKYKYQGFQFNYSGLEIDCVQVYELAQFFGYPVVFYDFVNNRTIHVSYLNREKIYPKRQLPLDQTGRVLPNQIKGWEPLDFLLIGDYDHKAEKTPFSKELKRDKHTSKANSQYGIKFICSNLTAVKMALEFCGWGKSFTTLLPDIIKQFHRNSKLRKLDELVVWAPNETEPVFQLINKKKMGKYYQFAANLNHVSQEVLKKLLEETYDNGAKYYQNAPEPEFLPELVKLKMQRNNNGYLRLNQSRFQQAITPKIEDNFIEFDRFPGFDKKSILKFSGINLAAKSERDRLRHYRRAPVIYDPEYQYLAFIDTIVNNFLKTTQLKLLPEQINLLRWLNYFELKTLPIESIKWSALKQVLQIPGINGSPPAVIYLYYLLVFVLRVTSRSFKKLYQIMVNQRIVISEAEIYGYLTREITLGVEDTTQGVDGDTFNISYPLLSLRQVMEQILLEYQQLLTPVAGNRMENKSKVNFYYPDRVNILGPIYADEQEKEKLFFRESNSGKIRDYRNIYNIIEPIDTTSGTNPMKFSILRLRSNDQFIPNKFSDVFKYQNLNIIIYYFLQSLVIKANNSPQFDQRQLFGPAYTNISSSAFKNFFQRQNRSNHLLLNDILLFVGSFWYIFLNSRNQTKLMPIYWNRYSFQDQQLDARLVIGPAGLRSIKASGKYDSSMYRIKIEDILRSEFTHLTTAGQMMNRLDQRVEAIPIDLNYRKMTKLQVFNLGYQKYFYQPLSESKTDPEQQSVKSKKKIEVDVQKLTAKNFLEMELKNEIYEPVGNICLKMYAFNQYLDQQLGFQKSFEEYLRIYTLQNPIFSQRVRVVNSTQSELEYIANLENESLPSSAEKYQVTRLKCRSVVTTADPQNKENLSPVRLETQFGDWLTSEKIIGTKSEQIILTKNQQLFYQSFSDQSPTWKQTLQQNITENDRGLNFSRLFDYQGPNSSTSYDIGTLRLSLATSAPVWHKDTNLQREVGQIFNHDHEVFNRIVRYFMYWQSISPVPFSMADIPILERKGEVIAYLNELISKQPTESFNLGNLVDYFFRIMIREILIPEIIDQPQLNVNYQTQINQFVRYMTKMEANVNQFQLSKYRDRQTARDMEMIAKLTSNDEFRRQYKIAPLYLKMGNTIEQLTRT